MLLVSSSLLLVLATAASAAKTSRTFSVNHFYGTILTTGRADPIVSPGVASAHVHSIMGGNKFNLTMTDNALLSSTCTTSRAAADNSNYWTPQLYFQHTNGTFEFVPMFYMNVYYFFEPTDDVIKEFPTGMRMTVGNPTLRSPPYTPKSILDTNQGTPQPIQWTCPRSSTATPLYPTNSDGLHGVGIQDPQNAGAGVGFPDKYCDGYASPLRADIHFPSCYNPAAGLDNYKTNMVFPSSAGATYGSNCPAGWIHVPHLFYEVYWNTPLFSSQWTQGQGTQPFILANGDPTGYSLHGDFIMGWTPGVLQQIIDNCNTGDSAIDTCPGLQGGLSDTSKNCNIPLPTPAGAAPEQVTGLLAKLPGNNPVVGWGGTVAGSSPTSTSSTTKATTTTTTSKTTSTSKATTTTSSASSSSTSGFVSAGCYSDSGNPRALTGVQFVDLGVGKVTTTGCISYCSTAGYILAGTEYAGQCFCGNSLNAPSAKIADSSCSMACEGDASQICGGSSALSVWQKSGSTLTISKRRHVGGPARQATP